MERPIRTGSVLVALLATGCGYIGEPLPPLANIPARVNDLAAVQRGSRIFVQFTIPSHTTEGVRLTWRARGENFKVFRKTQAEGFALVATVQQTQWTDPSAEFGRQYAYQVQTIVKLDQSREAESELSAEATITPVDTFPP